jgi:hypothetical protein
MKTAKNNFLVALSTLAVMIVGNSALAQSKARKFDELPIGIGSPRSWWPGKIEEDEKVMKRHLLRYAGQLRRERAQAYIIGYSPRVVEWEIYDRSYGDMRAGQARERLSEFFDYRRITTIDGGFRETAITELWIVPPGAQPPLPTPTIRPEDVAQCPFLRVSGSTYIPKSNSPLEFKATVETNGKKVQPTFSWKVSQGTIINGHGTDTISVELPEGASGQIIAKVDLGGFSLECPIETTTAKYQTAFGISYFKFDEYGDICSDDEKARLDNFAVQLQDNRELQAYVVFYGGRCYSSCGYDYPRHRPRRPLMGEAEARAGRIRPYLVNTRGLKPERIFVTSGGHRESWTAELWMVPKGEKPPPLSPTVQPQDIKYRKGQRDSLPPCM